MVGSSSYAWRTRSVPRIVDSRTSAVVYAADGGPEVVKARQQQEAMARINRVFPETIIKLVAKYGTKQESIEGVLEELNDMIGNYNRICSMQKVKQWE